MHLHLLNSDLQHKQSQHFHDFQLKSEHIQVHGWNFCSNFSLLTALKLALAS